MEGIRQWLLGVVACAMLVSLLRQLCPDGAVRQVARFTGGLLLLCALLRPLAAWEPPDAWDAENYRAAVERSRGEMSREAQGAFASGIERELEAYIEDKAESLGARVRAEVRADARGVPQGVTLYGAYSAALSELIERELGVAKEKQAWIET